MNDYSKELEKKINLLSDEELFQLIEVNFINYTDEALNIAKAIAEKRGGIASIKARDVKPVIRWRTRIKPTAPNKWLFIVTALIYVPFFMFMIFYGIMAVFRSLLWTMSSYTNHPMHLSFGGWLTLLLSYCLSFAGGTLIVWGPYLYSCKKSE